MLKKIILIVAICIFLTLSILGAFLPIIPGFVFFFAAIIMLSWIFPPIERKIHKLLAKFPRLKKHTDKAEALLKKWFRHN